MYSEEEIKKFVERRKVLVVKRKEWSKRWRESNVEKSNEINKRWRDKQNEMLKYCKDKGLVEK
jgi:uncharacterized membrane protein (DUF106 family)